MSARGAREHGFDVHVRSRTYLPTCEMIGLRVHMCVCVCMHGSTMQMCSRGTCGTCGHRSFGFGCSFVLLKSIDNILSESPARTDSRLTRPRYRAAIDPRILGCARTADGSYALLHLSDLRSSHEPPSPLHVTLSRKRLPPLSSPISAPISAPLPRRVHLRR